jgi:hypothetical protein
MLYNNTQWIQVSGFASAPALSTPAAAAATTLQDTLLQRKPLDQWVVATFDSNDDGKDLG